MISEAGSYGVASGPLTISLVRHGEASWAREGRNIDHPDLSDRGERQARLLGRALSIGDGDEWIASPLTRARRTAELACVPHEQLRFASWLAEIRYPRWEDEPREVAHEALARFRALPFHERWEAVEESGETVRAFVSRVRAGLQREFGTHGILPTESSSGFLWRIDDTHKHLVLLAHAGSISSVVSFLLGIPPSPIELERFRVAYCSISRLVTYPVGSAFAFSLQQLGYVEHLPLNLRSW
jgi:broad specificity phosphatase PhoE